MAEPSPEATPEALHDEIQAAVMELICWFPIASRTRQSAAEDIAKVAAGFAAAAVERERAKQLQIARDAAIEECAKELDAEAMAFEADFESEIFEQAAAHIRALASSPPRQSGWQPIETAPHETRQGE